jgi:hypothetical protein
MAGRRQSPWLEAPWLAARSSSSPSRAPKANPFPPTQSRQRGEMILLTYGIDDGEMARANLGDGADVLWWSSSTEDGSGGGGNDWWSSSKQKRGVGCSREARRWR